MQQAAPSKPHQGYTGMDSRIICTDQEQPSAEPNNKEGDQGVCSWTCTSHPDFFIFYGLHSLRLLQGT